MNVFVAGDFCPSERVADKFERNGFEFVLGSVKPIIAKADYSIVNFECPVVNDDIEPIVKIGPNLKCTEKGLEAVKWGGFNCVTLANNHFYDYADEGVRCTLDNCRKYKIDSVGGGMNLEEASRILYKQINGQVLAIINCCEHEFSIAKDDKGGGNPLDPIKQYYAIKEAQCHADFVLIIVHGGHEHWQLPSLRMQNTYRFFIDAGADAVVNHHQHCFSGYEVYQGKPIFYGLGNFCFDNHTKRKGLWTEGYAVIIEFNTESICYEIYPYVQCAENPVIEMCDKDAFSARIGKLNAVICNPEEMKREQELYYTDESKKCENLFEPFYNKYFLGAKRRGWIPSLVSKKKKLLLENFIECESHRDKVSWWLSSFK